MQTSHRKALPSCILLYDVSANHYTTVMPRLETHSQNEYNQLKLQHEVLQIKVVSKPETKL